MQCGKGKHSFWQDTVGEMSANLCEPRLWVKQIIAVAHKAFRFEQGYIFKMATKLDNERPKDHVHDGRTHEVY